MVLAWAKTDTGLRRKSNQDAYTVDAERGLVVVADGMGGHAAGEVASRLTVDTVRTSLARKSNGAAIPFVRKGREKSALLEAIKSANRVVWEDATANPERHRMGTTIAVLWAPSSWVHVANVGDSRVYRYRRGTLMQVTRDHALLDESGQPGNVLLRAIGIEESVEVDQRTYEATPGDAYLLCSDGLTRTVEDSEILDTLRDHEDGQTAVDRLVALSLERGAPDNVTVALARIPDS